MFHAERLRYTPLRGACLQAGDEAEVFFPALAETCEELEIKFLRSSEELQQYPLYVLHHGKNGKWNLHFSKSENSESELIYEGDPDSSDPLSDLLEAMLAAAAKQDKKTDKDVKPDMDYLRKTFADQPERYRDLLVLMVREYEVSKEAIAESIEAHDLENYRQVKHKLQPSTTYLRMPDFTRILEEVKTDFESVCEGERKDLAEQMFRYFDVIIDSLKAELEER